MKKTSARPALLRNLLLTIAFASLAAATACRPGLAQDQSTGQSAKQAAAEAEKAVQTVRGLRLKDKVPIIQVSSEQAATMLGKEIDREYTPEQLETDGLAGALIGLYPRAINLRAANLQLLQSQVIAFYDFHTRQMILVQGALQREFPGQPPELQEKLHFMILTHEFTHALQDQNFNFGAEEKKLKNDGDRDLALHSVAEGDATLSGYACMLGGMNPAVLSTLVSNLSNLSETFTGGAAGVPRGVSEPLVFQYTDGVKFVAEAYRRGGWDGVDKLYKDPPQSTQQIIDPALYYEHAVLPDRIKVAGYESILSGWHKADEDTLGELGLRIIFENELAKNSPDAELAAKWAGDRIAMLRRDKAASVIWLIAFRDPDSAAHFAKVYGKILDHVHGRRVAHRIEAKADAVLVVVGAPAVLFKTLAPAVWEASTITSPQRAVPQAGAPLQAGAPNATLRRVAVSN
jgi:hypothetical protein